MKIRNKLIKSMSKEIFPFHWPQLSEGQSKKPKDLSWVSKKDIFKLILFKVHSSDMKMLQTIPKNPKKLPHYLHFVVWRSFRKKKCHFIWRNRWFILSLKNLTKNFMHASTNKLHKNGCSIWSKLFDLLRNYKKIHRWYQK